MTTMTTTADDTARSAGRPEAIWSLGALMVPLALSPEVEVIDAWLGAGVSPPLHRHDFGTESFHVLEGRVRFEIGDEVVVCGPGELAHVPRSTPHSFETLEPSRVLDIIAPAGLWDFFVECGRPAPELRAPDGPELPADLAEIVTRHQGQVLGPPLKVRRPI
jgi:quercetin dioxygenase-like cupin family protein